MASCSHLVPWLMMVQSVRKGVGPLGVKIRTQYHGVPHPTDPHWVNTGAPTKI